MGVAKVSISYRTAAKIQKTAPRFKWRKWRVSKSAPGENRVRPGGILRGPRGPIIRHKPPRLESFDASTPRLVVCHKKALALEPRNIAKRTIHLSKIDDGKGAESKRQEPSKTHAWNRPEVQENAQIEPYKAPTRNQTPATARVT